MSMLSPTATFHAELREQLSSVNRALAVQRGLLWLARGLAVGLLVVLGLVVWAWTRDAVATLPIPLLVSAPIVAALLTAFASLFIRHNTPELARRVDRAAGLQERSTTALELGARGEEFPLAIAQMRDAVEHLKRVDLLEAFPLRIPKNELIAATFIILIAAIVGISPNPWLLRARASNPAITIAREQAQRVQRLADSLQPNDWAEVDALRQLVSKGARTMDARSNEPDAALNALQDLEDRVHQMSAGDDQLAAALAAIANALAADPTTQPLADAINTGDMRQISQAAKDLSQAVSTLNPQERQRVTRVMRDAANRAGRVSQSVASYLSTAADALQAADNAGAQGQGAQDGATGQGAQAASNALKQLSNSAAAADARQRTSSQLESSRNALERALGRTQSRAGGNGNSGRSSSTSPGSSGSRSGDQSSAGGSQGQPGDQGGEGADPSGGTRGGGQGTGGETGEGGGYSTGGQAQNHSDGSTSGLNAITRPEQVPSSGSSGPDQSSVNPYTTEAGTGNTRAAPESVQPMYSSKPTQANHSGSIPLGLRDLVKDYFSSLDQR